MWKSLDYKSEPLIYIEAHRLISKVNYFAKNSIQVNDLSMFQSFFNIYEYVLKTVTNIEPNFMAKDLHVLYIYNNNYNLGIY